MTKRIYDWNVVAHEVALLNAKGLGLSYRKLSKLLDIPVKTLHDNIDLSTNKTNETTKRESINGELEVVSQGDFPKSPEALAKLVGIDLSDYNIKSFDCFAREVYVKNIKKDLSFDEGKISGEIHDSGRMKVKTIWSSRMSVEPLKIQPRELILHPVFVNIPSHVYAEGSEKDKNLYTTLLLPDVHFGFGEYGPYHDEILLDKVIEFTNWLNPDEVVILGDLLDLAEFTDKFVLNPAALNSTQHSIDECAKFLANLRSVSSNIPISLLEGNHEFRMSSQLRKYLMAIAGLHPANSTEPISIGTFLNLNYLDVKYVEGWPKNYIQMGDVKILHGDLLGSRPGQSVSKMLEKYKQSTVFGHTHHREYAETTIWSDALNDYKTIFSYSPGCLCRVDGSVPGSSALQGWRQGIGILRTQLEGSSFIQDIAYDGKSKRFLV